MTTHASGRRGLAGCTRRFAASAVAIALGLTLLGASGPANAARGPSRDQTLVALRGRDAAGLRALLAAQHDPASADYRRWLTPREFGRRFGAAPRDLHRVERWLRERGCRVKRFPGRQQLACAGATPGRAPVSLGSPRRRRARFRHPAGRPVQPGDRGRPREPAPGELLLLLTAGVCRLLWLRPPARGRHRRPRADHRDRRLRAGDRRRHQRLPPPLRAAADQPGAGWRLGGRRPAPGRTARGDPRRHLGGSRRAGRARRARHQPRPPGRRARIPGEPRRHRRAQPVRRADPVGRERSRSFARRCDCFARRRRRGRRC